MEKLQDKDMQQVFEMVVEPNMMNIEVVKDAKMKMDATRQAINQGVLDSGAKIYFDRKFAEYERVLELMEKSFSLTNRALLAMFASDNFLSSIEKKLANS